jgi:hypothetical protein
MWYYCSSATHTIQARIAKVSGGSKYPKSGLLYDPGYFGLLTERDQAIPNPIVYAKYDLPRYTVVP